MLDLDLTGLPERLHLGTSSFSNPDWCGVFYPERARPATFLTHYATRLPTVEIDATFYATPAPSTVRAWREKVPDGFVIAAKAPRSITHDKGLADCDAELAAFLTVMDGLGPCLGPLLFQLPYVSKSRNPSEWATGVDFRRRLAAFLPKLPRTRRFAIEVRNERWITPLVLDLLREHGVALALTLYYTMPSPAAIVRRLDPVTTDFAYFRFLGDHRDMDRRVADAMRGGKRLREWGELLVDRTAQTKSVIPVLEEMLGRGLDVYGYFNNHYAGFGPGSIALLAHLWRERMSSDGASGEPV